MDESNDSPTPSVLNPMDIYHLNTKPGVGYLNSSTSPLKTQVVFLLPAHPVPSPPPSSCAWQQCLSPYGLRVAAAAPSITFSQSNIQPRKELGRDLHKGLRPHVILPLTRRTLSPRAPKDFEYDSSARTGSHTGPPHGHRGPERRVGGTHWDQSCLPLGGPVAK